MSELLLIVISAVVVNNFVLKYFLGICPFLGVSNQVKASLNMGMAVTFVMTLTAPVVWLINTFILVEFDLRFLEYVTNIIVIASLVQLVEMFIRKTSRGLYRTLGVYLPLITTNCAILFSALFLVLRGYNFIQSTLFGFGSGVGFTLAIVIMAGIREELEFAEVPEALKGAAITLLVAGLMALAFMGFAGMPSA
ncbi:RnfABCDGE type electron transport complex subunit A [candidate division NPL-UPA2 bacterium]|nr:RnfABCDGE type electron transport complex subunit A [candidate division NPL-UPA2 bacterium]